MSIHDCAGDLATVASRTQSMDADMSKDKEGGEEVIQNSRLSVFIHKREDQFPQEVIQPLLRMLGPNLEKAVRLDRELTKVNVFSSNFSKFYQIK